MSQSILKKLNNSNFFIILLTFIILLIFKAQLVNLLREIREELLDSYSPVKILIAPRNHIQGTILKIIREARKYSDQTESLTTSGIK